VPKAALLLEAAEDDLLAHMAFPPEHWSKLRSTHPLKRLNKEIGPRNDVIGIHPTEATLIRLPGPCSWSRMKSGLRARRDPSFESLTGLNDAGEAEPDEGCLPPATPRR
jgi:putative transposase